MSGAGGSSLSDASAHAGDFAPLSGEALADVQAFVRRYCAVWSTANGEPNWVVARRFYAPAEWPVYYDVGPPRDGYRGWDELSAGLRTNVYATIAALEWTPGSVWAIGALDRFAIVGFDWRMSTRDEAGRTTSTEGRMSMTLERSDGSWLIVHEHSSTPASPSAPSDGEPNAIEGGGTRPSMRGH